MSSLSRACPVSAAAAAAGCSMVRCCRDAQELILCAPLLETFAPSCYVMCGGAMNNEANEVYLGCAASKNQFQPRLWGCCGLQEGSVSVSAHGGLMNGFIASETAVRGQCCQLQSCRRVNDHPASSLDAPGQGRLRPCRRSGRSGVPLWCRVGSEGHGALVQPSILAVHGLQGCRALVLSQPPPQKGSTVHQVQGKGEEDQACMPAEGQNHTQWI